VLAAFCVALFLLVPPASIGPIRIAWAWLAGQTVFFFLLKAMVAAFPDTRVHCWRDALVLLGPVYVVVIVWDFVPTISLAVLCAVAGFAALAVLLLLLRRPFNPVSGAAPPGAALNGLV